MSMRQLNPKYFEVLAYINTHKIVTKSILIRRFGSASSIRALKKMGAIQAWPLYGNRVCYGLAGYGGRLLKKHDEDVSRMAHKPLSVTAKREFYAINRFCNEQERSERYFYRPWLDAELFPRIARLPTDRLNKTRFVRDGELLYLMIVDSGTQRFVSESVVPKVCSVLDRKKYPEFVRLRDAGLLQLVIATGTEGRADEIIEDIDDPANPPPIEWEIVAYRELSNLLPQLNQSHAVIS